MLRFDRNLSPRLPPLLAATFPGGARVRAAGLAEADDLAVWSCAQARGHASVTKDDDFRPLAFRYGATAGVIGRWRWQLHEGGIAALLRDRERVIATFLADQAARPLVLRVDPLAVG